jgi:hypothetical protein
MPLLSLSLFEIPAQKTGKFHQHTSPTLNVADVSFSIDREVHDSRAWAQSTGTVSRGRADMPPNEAEHRSACLFLETSFNIGS